VVDSHQRQAGEPRKGLRRRQADEQGADEPWLDRRGHSVQVAKLDLRAGEGLLDDRADRLDVRPARDLGHHPAVLRVQMLLRRDDARQGSRAVGDDGGGGLVARRLDAENAHGIRCGVPAVRGSGGHGL